MTEFHAQQLLGLLVLSALAWLAPKRWQMDSVAAVTMLLLAWFSLISFMLLCVSGALVFIAAHWRRNKGRTIALAIAYCAVQFLTLKSLQLYTDGMWATLSLLGLAYYTCRHIHYLIESFAGRIQADIRRFWHYQFFWPVMVAGPIHRYNHFLRECQRRRWDSKNVSRALDRIIIGYAKVIILGNFLVAFKGGQFLDQFSEAGLLFSWCESVLDWIYLYLQFSGWSDIAIGFALFMGIHIEENFNKPFLATNLIEFWLRWHITLSAWCRDYVFIPLLAVTRKPFLAVVAAMVTMGLWHEVSIYYLLWGLYHATGIACCRLLQNWQKTRDITLFKWQSWTLFSWALTMFFIVSGAPIITEVERLFIEAVS